jgi:hypothetical protein
MTAMSLLDKGMVIKHKGSIYDICKTSRVNEYVLATSNGVRFVQLMQQSFNSFTYEESRDCIYNEWSIRHIIEYSKDKLLIYVSY